MAELNDRELAELLVALGDYLPAAAPAQIVDHVPAHREPVDRVDEDHRRRSLLLSSIGPIVVMMASAFAYIEQLFKETGYDMNPLFHRPEFGEYLIHLTPQQKQVFCANTAYYIDAMRHNKQLEVVIDSNGIQRFQTLSDSASTGVTIAPSDTMTLNGNEVIKINDVGELVYKQSQREIVVPKDPLEISAFCMAHFFNTENVQILMNWGEDFKLISEEDLLRLLGQMGEGNDWKRRVVGKLLKSAYDVHNQTAAFNQYISSFTPNPVAQLGELQAYIEVEWEMLHARLPGITKDALYQFAIDHPNLWAAANNAINYPIPSAFFAFVILYYLRNPLIALGNITYEVARLPYRILNWLTGRNPDRPGADLLAIGNGDGHGGVMEIRGGGKQQPLSVIVINHPLPSLYLDKLAKIFDKKPTIFDKRISPIGPFVNHINETFGKAGSIESLSQPPSVFEKMKSVFSLKRKGTSGEDYEKRPKGDPTSVADIKGGKRKITRRRSKSTKRKHKNKRKTHKR
jgi:hypothetical protein